MSALVEDLSKRGLLQDTAIIWMGEFSRTPRINGNSGRDHTRQAQVAREVAAQIASGERGIVGVMAESFIEDGRQDADTDPLVYGKSITDACIGWDATAVMLRSLAESVRARRAVTSGRSADSRNRAPSRSTPR